MARKNFRHQRITFESDSTSRRRDEKDEEQEPSTIGYLQPETLPAEMMKSLLMLRGAGNAVKNEDDVEKLVQLFYKHITPKPQRSYRENRKGKILLKLQRRNEKLKKDVDKDWKVMETDSARSVSSITSSSSTLSPETAESRLKRPIINAIDPNKKKIKLSSSGSSLDSINIIKRTKSTEESKSVSATNQSEGCNGGKDKGTLVSPLNNSSSKKLKLNRDSPNDINKTSSEVSPSLKKKTPISWP